MLTLRKIALLLVVIGLILCLMAAFGTGFRFDQLLPNVQRTFQSRDYDASEVKNVSLSFDVDTVIIKPSEDGNVHLSWYSCDPSQDELQLSDGKLSLKTARKPLHSLDMRNYEAELLLPPDFGGEVSVSASVGSIKASKLNPGLLKLSTTTGSIQLSDLNVSGDVSTKSTTGSVHMTNVAAASLTHKDTTGSVKLSNVSANSVYVRVTTGSITLETVDAQSYTLDCTTGSIKGAITGTAADYTIRSSVTTGSTSLPEKQDGGTRTLNACATTGSIHISFEDAK